MNSIRTRLTVAAGVVIIALTIAAFWLSYAHLHDVAAENGLGGSPERAWAWPATLDLFIVAGEIMMLVAALAKRRDPWAIGLTVAGSVGSIALNVFGVGSGAEPLEYVVAAVPPAAALLAFGALMRQIHAAVAEPDQKPTVNDYAAVVDTAVERLAEEVQIPASLFRDPALVQVAAEEPSAHPTMLKDLLEELDEELAATEEDDQEEPAPALSAPEEVLVHRISTKPTVAEISAAVEDIQSEGEELTGKALAAYFGVSDRSGRRYLKDWAATQAA